MIAPHLTHDLVCVGTHAPGEHDFHSANARAVNDHLTGGLGPPRIVSDVLTGSRVTAAAVGRALEASAERATKNHIFYFSGRATPVGLEVADGTIPSDMLARHFLHVRAHAILVLLDVAIGAQPDEALLPPWIRALVQERNGLRVVASRATRIGTAVEGAGLARFTSALLAALEAAPGDLQFEQAPFVSDKRAVAEATRILGDRWGVTNLPLQLGALGDMPLARSQTAAPIGSGSVESAVVGTGLSVSVAWILEGRANVQTTLHYALESADGGVIGSGATTLVAKNPLQKGKTRVRLMREAKKSLARSGGAPTEGMKWRITLRDARDRILAEETVAHAHAAPEGRKRSRR